MGRRVAALVGAVVMVLAAVGLRRALDGEEVLPIGDAAVVVCEPILETSCNQAFGADRVRTEAPGVVADRLVAGEVEPMIWVTSPLWFEIVSADAERRGREDPVGGGGDALVHGELVLLATESTAESCGGAVDWSCLADPDLGLDLGLDPMTTTVGLESYGRLVAAHLGRADFATNDFDGDFSSWRRRLDAAIDRATLASPAYSVFLAQRGRYDAATASSAELARLSRELDGVVQTGDRIEVGVAAIGGADLGRTSALQDALEADGWEAGGAPDAERPSAGALQALRS